MVNVNIRNKNVVVAVFYLILFTTFLISLGFSFILIYNYALKGDYNVADYWIQNKKIVNIILVLIFPILSTGYALSQIFLNIWLLLKKSRRALMYFGWTTIASTIISFVFTLISQLFHDLLMDKSDFPKAFQDVQRLENKYYVSVYFNIVLFIVIVALSLLCLIVSKSVFIRIKPSVLAKSTSKRENKKDEISTKTNNKTDFKNEIRSKIHQENPLLNSNAKPAKYPASSKQLIELDYNLIKVLNSYVKTHPSEINEELIKMYKEIYSSKNNFKLDVLMNLLYKEAIKIKPSYKFLKDAIAQKMQEKFVPELQLDHFKAKIKPALETRLKEDEEKFISIINGWIEGIDKKLAAFDK